MRTENFNLFTNGLSNAYANFPLTYCSHIDNSGAPIIDTGSSLYYDAPFLMRQNRRSVSFNNWYYNTSQDRRYDDGGGDYTMTLSDTQNFSFSAPTYSSWSVYEDTGGAPMSLNTPFNYSGISGYHIFDIKFDVYSVSNNALNSLGADFEAEHSFMEHVTANLYKSPRHFRTSDSYYFDIDNYTTKLPLGSCLEDEIEAELNFLIGGGSFIKSVSDSASDGGKISSCSLNTTVTFTKIPNWFQYKLLNRDDWDLIRITPTLSMDISFFDGLSSPTFAEARAAGGCEFWGVIKKVQYPFSNISWSVTFSASMYQPPIGGPNPQASSSGRIYLDYQAPRTAPRESNFIENTSRAYYEQRKGQYYPINKSTANANDNFPCVVLTYK